MPERYQKLYDLPYRLYASGSPVLIEAGALLLELTSNAMLCQLRFRSLSEQPIKSIRAEVQPLAEDGESLGKSVVHRYGDLNLKRDEVFGRETAIVLTSERAASFRVRLSQVCFADGAVWTDEGLVWRELPDQPTLEEFCGGEKQAARFRRHFGESCRTAPAETEDLWFCACGGINLPQEKKCHRCGCRRSAMLGREGLSSAAEREEFGSAPYEEKAPRPTRKRGLLLGAAALVLLGLLALALLPRLKQFPQSGSLLAASTHSDSRQAAYEEAQAMLENGDLDRAEQVFRSLSGFEDSDRYLEQDLPYRRALALQEKADFAPLEDAPALYEAAAEAFEQLGNYEDCRKRALYCREELKEQRRTLMESDYAEANLFLENGRCAEAREAFLALGDYEDSAELALEAAYRRGLALYLFAKEHDVRGVTASLTLDPGRENLVAMSRERLLALGEEGMRELEDCFGEDPVRFLPRTTTDDQLPPLEEAAAQLLLPLGDYRDSAEMAAELPEMVDESDTFFVICEAGDLEGARSWLNDYDKPFEDRELWLQRIELYLSCCGSWEMNTGDPTLASQITGGTEEQYHIRTRVRLLKDKAVLCLLPGEGSEKGPEFSAELGDTRFMLYDGDISYLVQINPGGSLNLVKIAQYGGGVEYLPEK